jgi:twitching motility protein PilJ
MSTASGFMESGESSGGLKLVGGLLFIVVVLFGLNFWWSNVQDTRDRLYLAKANEIQVLSQQIATQANEAANGNFEAFEDLETRRRQIRDLLGDLQGGVGTEELIPVLPPMPNELVGNELNAVAETWAAINENSQQILAREQLVLNLAETEASFQADVPRLQRRTDEVIRILIRSGAPSSQVYIVSQQLVLADRMLRRVREVLQGGFGAMTAADGFSRDVQRFEQVLNGLLGGDEDLGIRAIQDDAALEILGDMFTIFEGIRDDVDQILAASSELLSVRQAADRILLDSEDLRVNAATLSETYEAGTEQRLIGVISGLVLGGVAIFLLFILLFILNKGARDRARVTEEINQRNQEAIMRLLDEMGSLAEGDLTVQATVTEDITGAIADSVNFAVEALRSLVTTINETALQVASAAQETQSTAMHLAEAAEHQSEEITKVSTSVNDMAQSIDEVSKNAADSADVARRSVDIANKGADVVRQTIDGMDTIREQIQETSKRIKRLGESSQEIGDIVELINDIAEQTNILSLNAAIQAANAGEAGHGFAVVADEVQRLAERASNATKQIEALVKTIQTDTNEAVISMEQTTADVVSGARLAENAGEALGEIEKVSNDLASLIQTISEASRQQAEVAGSVSNTMNVIQEITSQTTMGTNQTAESIGNLAQLASDLRKSVADFKLPDDEEELSGHDLDDDDDDEEALRLTRRESSAEEVE